MHPANVFTTVRQAIQRGKYFNMGRAETQNGGSMRMALLVGRKAGMICPVEKNKADEQ
jgi:hypothetical protein